MHMVVTETHYQQGVHPLWIEITATIWEELDCPKTRSVL